MKTFKELKEEILTIAKEKDACSDGYEYASKSENYQELLKVSAV